MTLEERLIADPRYGAEVVAGARALAWYRMMLDRGPDWDSLSEEEKLEFVGQSSVVVNAAREVRRSRKPEESDATR